MKIAIAVQGRFHAFELARALMDRGHDVTLFTTYPPSLVNRWGFPPDRVQHAPLWHLMFFRAVPYTRVDLLERWVHNRFGKWCARRLRKDSWDAVHVWSGVAEEPFCALENRPPVRTLMRGSAHIRSQEVILREEEKRAGVSLQKPTSWRISKEEREYEIADLIVCLSEFAERSFLERGISPEKLCKVTLGVRESAFRANRATIEERVRRIVAEEPLRVLYVGTISHRKGLFDVSRILDGIDMERFKFRFVGAASNDAGELIDRLSDKIEFIPKQPERELGSQYAWGDIFLFPTLEDGFAAVLAQACAGGLPIIASGNSGAPELVDEGRTGWIVEARDSDGFRDRLEWCDKYRDELAETVRNLRSSYSPRSWDSVAQGFEECLELRRESRTKQ